jgi:hypothetical protein
MPHYPGQQPRRWPFAVLAVVVAVGAGLLIGRVTASSSADAAPKANGSASCPGGRDDAGRRAAAVCLVQAYYAVASTSDRDARLADLVVPGQLDAARKAYKALDAKVSNEYAAVAATNLQGSDADATGQAWVAFVDSYKDGSPALAQWWITSFGLHWQSGRWWLAGGVGTRVDATPPSAGSASTTGFGPGWVAAGGS